MECGRFLFVILPLMHISFVTQGTNRLILIYSLSSRTVRKYVLVLTLCRLGKCVVSSQLFGFPTSVEIHQQSHSGEEPREYKECGNSFVYPRSHCTCNATENVGNAIVFSFLQRCKKVPKGKRK